MPRDLQVRQNRAEPGARGRVYVLAGGPRRPPARPAGAARARSRPVAPARGGRRPVRALGRRGPRRGGRPGPGPRGLAPPAGRGERLAGRGRRRRAGAGRAGGVRAVGCGVVVLGAGPGPGGEVLVPLAAVTSLRAGPGDGPVVGDRPTGDGPTLVDLLADLAAERAAVRVVTVGGDAVAGELRAVGRDVLVVAPSGGGAAYVALGAVAEVAVGSPGPA